jgi:predicted deacylase
MQTKLEKNIGGYAGEKIDVRKLLADLDTVAHEQGWTKHVFHKNPEFEFPAYVRKGAPSAPKVFISAGIHGDEPAPPLAALELMKMKDLDENLNIWMCPCLNPSGLLRGTRENEKGVDLNRDYREPQTDEVRAHIAWLESVPAFDLTLSLHEDWESEGFYILMPEKVLHAEKIIDAVKKVFPIDQRSVIEGFAAHNGMVSPVARVSEIKQWPEAFYLAVYKKGEHYTLETSSDFPLHARVTALVEGSRAACETLSL